MKAIAHTIITFIAMAMCSCLAPQNVVMEGIDMHLWSNKATIIYDNCDTLSLRNLNIALRYNDNFKQAILPLKIVVTTPDARYFEEVVELRLEHPGTALTIATTESVPYRTDVLLNQKGGYTFAFEPLQEVKGVEAIGIEFQENGKR